MRRRRGGSLEMYGLGIELQFSVPAVAVGSGGPGVSAGGFGVLEGAGALVGFGVLVGGGGIGVSDGIGRGVSVGGGAFVGGGGCVGAGPGGCGDGLGVRAGGTGVADTNSGPSGVRVSRASEPPASTGSSVAASTSPPAYWPNAYRA